MRALAGPAMLLVVVGSFGLHRLLSKPEAPSRAFLELELAGGDDQHTGSCYSLSTVLIANAIFSDATRDWKPAHEGAWTLSVEEIHQDNRGPVHVFHRYTFEQREDQAHLVTVQASDGLETDVAANIDAMLEAPNDRSSTPVDRCRHPGATGYGFKPRR
jgi:hypothetical protein